MNVFNLHDVTSVKVTEVRERACESGQPYAVCDLIVTSKSGPPFCLTLFAAEAEPGLLKIQPGAGKLEVA